MPGFSLIILFAVGLQLALARVEGFQFGGTAQGHFWTVNQQTVFCIYKVYSVADTSLQKCHLGWVSG